MRCLRAALPAYRIAKFMRLAFHARQGELKYRTARFIRVSPQPPPVGIDDRPADRQSHLYSARLRRIESVENTIEMVWIDARPGIAHGHENATGLGLLGADRQLSWPRLDRAHGFDRV